jgi:hypothetical protein
MVKTFLEILDQLRPDQEQETDVPVSGTPKYKNGLVYIYCNPEDRERARHFSKVLGCSMTQVLHKLMFAAEISIANPDMPVMVVTWSGGK